MDLDALLQQKIDAAIAARLPGAVTAELDRRARTPQHLSLIAAARRAHVGNVKIQEAIESGALYATKHPGKNANGEWHIAPADLDAWNMKRLERLGRLPVPA